MDGTEAQGSSGLFYLWDTLVISSPMLIPRSPVVQPMHIRPRHTWAWTFQEVSHMCCSSRPSRTAPGLPGLLAFPGPLSVPLGCKVTEPFMVRTLKTFLKACEATGPVVAHTTWFGEEDRDDGLSGCPVHSPLGKGTMDPTSDSKRCRLPNRSGFAVLLKDHVCFLGSLSDLAVLYTKFL